MRRKGLWCYLIFTFAVCILPLAGMPWKMSGESGENRTLAEFPSIREEDGWNVDVLADAGAYFEDHFAWRQELVTADAVLRGKLLGVSAKESVIAGTDGWLYYKDSLEDYQGENVLSDRAIFNISHTLRMMQDYVERGGRKFIFTVAPNKNSLYNEHMPYYDNVIVSDIHNIDLLKEAMEQEDVHFVDLFHVFESRDEVLYHQRDSHWNNMGASLAAQELLDALEKEHRLWQEESYEMRTDFEGDLDKMLYPGAVTLEDEFYFTEPFRYEYVGEVESNFDPEIRTVSSGKDGSLLMYRDSFGNALLPFMAEEFGSARFSRGIPYYLDDMIFCSADTVIVERSERFLPDMGKNPPVAQAPLVMLNTGDCELLGEDDANYATCETSDEGLYLKFSGTVEKEQMQTDSQIYLRLDGEYVYEAFPVTVETEEGVSDYGYAACIEKEKLEGEEGKAELFVTGAQGIRNVFQGTVTYMEQ